MTTPLEEERARLQRATMALHASLDIREHLLSLSESRETVRLVLAGEEGSEGMAVMLPRAALDRLVEVLESMGNRQEPQVLPLAKELSTGEVAEMMGVTRAHVVRLIDRGVLPAHRVGPRRRVRLSAALTYMREEQRRNGQTASVRAGKGQPPTRYASRRRVRPEPAMTADTREVVRRYANLRPPPVGPEHPAG